MPCPNEKQSEACPYTSSSDLRDTSAGVMLLRLRAVIYTTDSTAPFLRIDYVMLEVSGAYKGFGPAVLRKLTGPCGSGSLQSPQAGIRLSQASRTVGHYFTYFRGRGTHLKLSLMAGVSQELPLRPGHRQDWGEHRARGSARGHPRRCEGLRP